MNRTLSALFSALEALIVVAIGIAVPLVPLTILWGAQYGFAPDWTIFWRISADIWLVGHGTDLTLTLDAATAKASGLAGAGTPFVVSMAVLGFALLTLLLGRRAGRRIGETQHRLLGELIALAVFIALSFGVAASASQVGARVSVVEGTLLPTLVFVLGLLAARLTHTEPKDERILRRAFGGWRPEVRATVMFALRGGAAAASGVVVVAAVALAGLLLVGYAQIITLYENLHSGALGGAALTLAQLALLPNLVVWAASWLVGPGFAIGAGSAVSPLGTTLGPLPAIPVLGALPHGSWSFSFAGVLVPILAGFLAGAILRVQMAGMLGVPARLPLTLATGLGMGIVGGALLGLLAWASAGSMGPGRLQAVGPDPWSVGLWAALEIGAAALLGMAAASRLRRDT
jgi:hypothetical protein